MSNIHKYLERPGFELVACGNQVAIKVPSQTEAEWLIEAALDELAALAQQFRQRRIEIFWKGCKRRMRVLADWKGSFSQQVDERDNRLPSFDDDLPTLNQLKVVNDTDLAVAIFSSKKSACITTVGSNKIIAANFAVVPSHGKPFHEMIGSDLTPLWDEDELNRVMTPLDRDGLAHNLEYWTWRWEQQPDGSYHRVRQFLQRHFFDIQFANVRCRLTLGI